MKIAVKDQAFRVSSQSVVDSKAHSLFRNKQVLESSSNTTFNKNVYILSLKACACIAMM